MPDSLLNRKNVGALHLNSSVQPRKPHVLRPVLTGDAIAAARRKRTLLARFPHATFVPESKREHAQLLRCDLDLQLNHFEQYGPYHQRRLETVYKKVNYERKSGEPGYWKNIREWKHYDATATLMALSNHHRADAVCDCGVNGFSCGDRLVCCRCCFNRLAEPAVLEFGGCFNADRECYYIVMSLSREPDEKRRLIFKDLTKSEMEQIKLAGGEEQETDYGVPYGDPLEDQVQTYFKIYAQVIHEFVGSRPGQMFSGAFGGPELAVRFLPLAVLPHANYVAWSPGLSSDDVRLLRRVLREKMRGCRRLKHKLFPKLAVYRIQSPRDLKSVIEYIFKPIDFAFAYERAADRVDCDPRLLRQLNEQVNYFFECLRSDMFEVRRMNRYGCCSSVSNTYMGRVTAERKARRKKDAERREARRKKDAEVRKKFPAYKPHRRHPSPWQREDTGRMRRIYERFMEEGAMPIRPPRRWLRQGEVRRGGRRHNRQRRNAVAVLTAERNAPSDEVVQGRRRPTVKVGLPN